MQGPCVPAMALVRRRHGPRSSPSHPPEPVMQTTSYARVVRQVRGAATSDGAGGRLTRVIGRPALPDHDPWLQPDRLGTDQAEAYLAGVPSRSHRGVSP